MLLPRHGEGRDDIFLEENNELSAINEPRRLLGDLIAFVADDSPFFFFYYYRFASMDFSMLQNAHETCNVC